MPVLVTANMPALLNPFVVPLMEVDYLEMDFFLMESTVDDEIVDLEITIDDEIIELESTNDDEIIEPECFLDDEAIDQITDN